MNRQLSRRGIGEKAFGIGCRKNVPTSLGNRCWLPNASFIWQSAMHSLQTDIAFNLWDGWALSAPKSVTMTNSSWGMSLNLIRRIQWSLKDNKDDIEWYRYVRKVLVWWVSKHATIQWKTYRRFKFACIEFNNPPFHPSQIHSNHAHVRKIAYGKHPPI